jgi:four helix bundle protein
LNLQRRDLTYKGDFDAGLPETARVAEIARLALTTYELPAYLTKPEAWPLREQILRAAISIPSNIAEGAGRGSNPDFRRFLWNSMGSCNELESQLLLASDLKFTPSELHSRLGNDISEVRKMLSGLIPTLG